MENRFTLRERKKAALRRVLLDTLLSLLKEKCLSEISVEMICDLAQTNKVTFFQNFKHKEQVLDYFVCKWGYDRSFEMESGKYAGYNGLKSIFDSISRDPLGLKIMVSLVGYYARIGEVPEMPTISACEYESFNADAFAGGVSPRTLEGLFMRYLSQIPNVNPKKQKELLQVILAVFYGVPMQMHVTGRPQSEMASAYGVALKAALVAHG